MLEQRTREILQQYTMKLTIRQVYYRLVSAQDIENNKSQYTYFDKILTRAREKDITLARYFEDKTRQVISEAGQDIFQEDLFSKMISDTLEKIVTCPPRISYSPNNFQKNIVVIFLEKRALENVFLEALREYCGYVLITAGGFSSFTQMYELSRRLLDEKRKIKLFCFGDYDDSGILIRQSFISQCSTHLGIEFDEIKDIALTQEQIEGYNLPQNPTIKRGKKKNTHTLCLENQGKNLDYFVELDALDPNILSELIKKCVSDNFDWKVYNLMTAVEEIRNRRLKKAYLRSLKKIDIDKLIFDLS